MNREEEERQDEGEMIKEEMHHIQTTRRVVAVQSVQSERRPTMPCATGMYPNQ
jgi:hypothetical protein